MKILVLCSDNPNPPINGVRIRNFHLWPLLRSLGHEVRILSLTRNPGDLKLNNTQVEYFLFDREVLPLRVWKRLNYSYHQYPTSLSLAERLKEIELEWRPDVIHAEELRMGHYLPSHSQALLSICAHNVESELILNTKAAPFGFAVSFFNALYRKNLIKFERSIFTRAKLRLTYSEIDQQKYHSIFPEFKFLASSNGVNEINQTESEKKIPDPKKILFLGSLHYLPNVDALFWFLDHVYPSLKSKIDLTVAGSSPLQIVKERLASLQIPLLDTPLDLKPVYTENSLLLVPLLSGSGTRGKILESLMYHRPVLTTPIGVEGLHLEQGVLVASGVEGFVTSINQWLEMSPQDRQELADLGQREVAEKYSWKKVAKDLVKYWSTERSPH